MLVGFRNHLLFCQQFASCLFVHRVHDLLFFHFLFISEVDKILSAAHFFFFFLHMDTHVLFPSESQNLSVHLTLRPMSAIGVLFALVYQDRVPLSIALADYHPGTDEWRDVSTLKFKL